MELIHWFVSKPVLVLTFIQFVYGRSSSTTTSHPTTRLHYENISTTTTFQGTTSGICDNLSAEGPSGLSVFYPEDTIPVSCVCYETMPYRRDGSTEGCPQWTVLTGSEYIVEVKQLFVQSNTGCQADRVFMVKADLDRGSYELTLRCSVPGSDLGYTYEVVIQGGSSSRRGLISDHRLLFYCLVTIAFLLAAFTAFVGIFCRRHKRRRRREARGIVPRVSTPNFDGTDNQVCTVSEGVIQDRPPPYQETVLPSKTCDLSILPPK